MSTLLMISLVSGVAFAVASLGTAPTDSIGARGTRRRPHARVPLGAESHPAATPRPAAARLDRSAAISAPILAASSRQHTRSGWRGRTPSGTAEMPIEPRRPRRRPAAMRIPWWRRLRSTIGLGALVAILGVGLAAAVGLLLFLAGFLLEQVVSG